MGDETEVFGPHDGVITIPRFTVHQYGRADRTTEGAASKNVDLIVKEWTDPADGEKELFFRNVLGLIKDRRQGIVGSASTILSLFALFWHRDNYPVLWAGPRIVGRRLQAMTMRLTTYSMLGLAAMAGRLLGRRGYYAEYTPSHLTPTR